MADTLSDWLALREAADTRARSAAITHAIAGRLPLARPLRVLDLGAGTGSNIRFLTPRLPAPQEWMAVDRDATLLAQVPPHVATGQMSLGSLDGLSAFSALLSGRHLVTGSALLDLVSASWIAMLAERCRDAGAAVLFALTYDGRTVCSPREPEDDLVLDLFNRHQRSSDKGFGAAAGPDANDCAVRCFIAAGYHVHCEPSDWELGPDSSQLQIELIAGWARAAKEIAPQQAGVIERWMGRRVAHVHDGRSRLRVGHQDLAAWRA